MRPNGLKIVYSCFLLCLLSWLYAEKSTMTAKIKKKSEQKGRSLSICTSSQSSTKNQNIPPKNDPPFSP